MRLGNLLVNLGTAALGTLNPIVGASIAAVLNTAFDSDDDKVKLEDTGQTILNKLNLLPSDQKEKLLKEDVSLQLQLSEERINRDNNNLSLNKMLNSNETANRIVAKCATSVLVSIAVYGSLIVIVALCQIYLLTCSDTMETTRIQALSDVLPSWELVGTMLVVPAFVVKSFFSSQTKDMLTLTNGMNGFKTSTFSENLKSLVRSKRQ